MGLGDLGFVVDGNLMERLPIVQRIPRRRS